jgi:uncharacterized membrane protein
MRDLIETITYNLYRTGEFVEVILNALSLICIVAGVFIASNESFKDRRRLPGRRHPLHTNFRKLFGGWLIVALEFQLAADIVGTIVSPTTQHLIELGAVAVIRTFLNYFLNKELHEETELSHTGIPEKKG